MHHRAGAQAGAATCGNCSAPLQGPYCHVCGQRDLDPDITVREVAQDVVHEALSLDGKLLLTLRWLIGRPGGLTVETLHGRRARYAPPLRLYLTCSLLFFGLSAIAPRPEGVITYRSSPPPRTLSPEEELRRQQREQQTVQAIADGMRVNMPRAMFLLMPFFALLTWVMYRKSRRRYIPHLYYSLHFHSLVFLVMTAGVLLSIPGGWLARAGVIFPLVLLVYHFAGLRRVFGGGWIATVVKGSAIVVLYMVALAGVLIAITYPVVARAAREAEAEGRRIESGAPQSPSTTVPPTSPSSSPPAVGRPGSR